MKHCSHCQTDKGDHAFYNNDRYCIQCRKVWSVEYYRRKYKGEPVKRKWNKVCAADLDNAAEWNKKHPYVFTSCKAFIEHKIFTGVITI